MGPATTSNPEPLGGVYPAVVARVFGLAQGETDALASNITYDVWVNFPDGPELFERVVPRHRRPSSVLRIEPAQPNDECVFVLRGGKAGFIIFEGLSAGDECT